VFSIINEVLLLLLTFISIITESIWPTSTATTTAPAAEAFHHFKHMTTEELTHIFAYI
jgi:hypothetical protein